MCKKPTQAMNIHLADKNPIYVRLTPRHPRPEARTYARKYSGGTLEGFPDASRDADSRGETKSRICHPWVL
jgi:hypothetical protein